jgi:Raf kinase inhibitor-like YbhB/YbcL family protein
MRNLRRSFTLAVAVASTAALAPHLGAAQPRPGQTPAAPPAQTPPRPRTVQVMTLESPSWTDGGVIPDRHAQVGRDVSPPLRWRGAPVGTQSFALVVRDVDELIPATGAERLHWLVWNIPPASDPMVPAGQGSMAERQPAGNPQAARGAAPGSDGARQVSATGPAYRGPAAPASGPEHHYLFELFALDTMLPIDVGPTPAATLDAVRGAMTGHILAKGVLVGRYRRPAP